MENAENVVAWFGLVRGPTKVTQGHGQCHHSIECIRLPIRLIETVSIFYCFRDIASYLSKVADFDPPHLHLASPYGLPRQNFAEICGLRKLESLGYCVLLFV